MKTILLMVLFCTLLFGQDAKQLVKEGDALYNKFDNLNAVKKYEEALKADPNSFDALYKLTRAYNSAGEEFSENNNKGEAEKYFNKAVTSAEELNKKHHGKAESYAYMAVSYGNLGLFKGSKEKIKISKKVEQNGKAALKANPNYYLPYLILGKYNYEIANLSWVEKTFANTFLGKVPDGSFEESEKMLKKCLQIEPGLPIAMLSLAKTYIELDREQEAKDLLTKVINSPAKEFRDKFLKQKAKKLLNDL